MQYSKRSISFLTLVKPINGHLTTIKTRMHNIAFCLIEYLSPYPDTVAFECRPTNHLSRGLEWFLTANRVYLQYRPNHFSNSNIKKTLQYTFILVEKLSSAPVKRTKLTSTNRIDCCLFPCLHCFDISLFYNRTREYTAIYEKQTIKTQSKIFTRQIR